MDTYKQKSSLYRCLLKVKKEQDKFDGLYKVTHTETFQKFVFGSLMCVVPQILYTSLFHSVFSKRQKGLDF